MSTNIRIKRICDFCLQEFTAKTTKTKYCSHKCNSRAYKAAVREQKMQTSNAETTKIINIDIEKIKVREFLNITQAGRLFGISRRTVYRLIDRGHLNIAKFGTRTVIRKCDLEAFFAVPIIPQKLEPVQSFPGIENCYTIGQAQAQFNISPAALYHLLHRHGIMKYCVGKFAYVPKTDLDIIFNEVAERVTQTEFFDCSYWIGSGIAAYLTKGSIVELSGRVSARAWVTAEGEAKAGLNFHTSKITLHGGTGKEAAADGKLQTKDSSTAATAKAMEVNEAKVVGTGVAPDDDLPF